MANQYDDTVDIRPSEGDTMVPIPFTLETPRISGDRRYRNRIYFAMGITVIFLIFDVGYLFGSSSSWFIRPFFLALLAFGQLLFIRYLVLEEKQYRKDIQNHYLKDYRMPTSDIWGIYNIDSDYPYTCYFRTGRRGLFVTFEKNVKIGRNTTEHHFKHYEAIAAAYRWAGNRGLTVTHIDYMGNIGVDTRLDGLFDNLKECQNEDVRDILTGIYSGLREDALSNTTSQDVYLISANCSIEDLWEAFQGFKDNMLEANYVTFRILNKEGVRKLTQELFNLKEFSASKASLSSVSSQGNSGIVPVRLINSDGSVTVLTKQPKPQSANSTKKDSSKKLKKRSNNPKKQG